MLLRNQVEKRTASENPELDPSCLDEAIDERYVIHFLHLTSPQRTLHLVPPIHCEPTTRLFAIHSIRSVIVETDSTTVASQASQPKADTMEVVISE